MANLPAHGKALAWAEKQLGEREHPDGSNTGPFVVSCQRATWLPGTRWPWCVAFWQKAWKEAGRPLPWLGAGAYALLSWARKEGWAVDLDRAVPGDAVVFNIGSGHCAMLARPYKQTKPNVETVDGNVSDMVARRTRPAALVRGCVHVPEHPQPKPPPRKPLFEIVTSESGHAKVVYVAPKRAVAKKLAKVFNKHGGLTVRRHKRKP